MARVSLIWEVGLMESLAARHLCLQDKQLIGLLVGRESLPQTGNAQVRKQDLPSSLPSILGLVSVEGEPDFLGLKTHSNFT